MSLGQNYQCIIGSGAIHAGGAGSPDEGVLEGAPWSIEPMIMPTMKTNERPRIIATIKSVAVRGESTMPGGDACGLWLSGRATGSTSKANSAGLAPGAGPRACGWSG